MVGNEFEQTHFDASSDISDSLSENEHGQPQQPPEINHSHDTDDHSGEVDRPYTGYFEGPEKTLEICFRPASEKADYGTKVGERIGLRKLEKKDLDRICKRARCTILSCVSNQYLDAYVLSESSLFVYPYMMVLKTCGTTTLLRCVGTVLELARRIGLELDWVGYSRKNFNFPGDQCFPHQSFNQELEYLDSHQKLSRRLDGHGYTLGPVNNDHWFVYVADQTIRNTPLQYTDRVLNIMMFDIDQTVAKIFYYYQYGREEGESDEEATRRISLAQTKKAGIDALCPGAKIDPCAFQPCGYSMNAILFHSYCTMHITPEDGSSYASFETNQKAKSYTSLINNVIRTFKPKRFVMTLMADEGGLCQIEKNPLTTSGREASIVLASKDKAMDSTAVYKRSSLASIQVEEDCCCIMGKWVLEENPARQRSIRASKVRGESFA